MTEGAPDACQVTDRFHLVQNLSETLAQALGGYRTELKVAEQAWHQTLVTASPEEMVIATPQPAAIEKTQAQAGENQQRRVEQQKAIKTLQAKG